MASQETIDRRKAVLKARGVPERFIDAIATRKGAGALSNVVAVALLLALCAVVAPMVMDLPLSAPLIPIFYGRASSSLLFYAPFSLPLLTMFAMMAFIFVAFAVYASAVHPSAARPYPAFNIEGERLRALPPGQSLPMIMPDARFAELAHLPDDAAFLDAARKVNREAKQPLWTWIIVIFWGGFVTIFSIGPQVVEAMRYKVVTDTAVEQHRPGRTLAYPFSQVQSVEVRCHGGLKYGFSYRLVYANDRFDIWEERDDLHGLGADGVLQRLTQIDRRLTELGVPIDRMGRTGSPRDDAEDCIRDMAKAWKLGDTRPLRQLVFGADGGQP